MNLIKRLISLSITISLSLISASALAEGKPVGITPNLFDITIKHKGKLVKLMRNQDTSATIDGTFARTSRPCPPACIRPMSLGKGIETIGEIEIINYAKTISDGDKNTLLIDSRTPDQAAGGTIPGSINISWVELTPREGATTESIMKLLSDRFDVTVMEGKDDIDVDEAIAGGDTSDVFDYTKAKTLVMFCNGSWCGQSPASIAALRKFGYPANKILSWWNAKLEKPRSNNSYVINIYPSK